MNRTRLGGALVALCCVAPLWTQATEAPTLQELVDRTPDDGILVPPPGVYHGSLTIERPLTIDGRGQVTIDADGHGSVVYLDTDGGTLKGLHLTNSGVSYNDIDAGVQVRGRFNVVKDCLIDDCLFGIDLQQSEFNIIRRDTISSKPYGLGQRGDSVRLWYSFHNKVQDNVCHQVRDMVVWYSAENEITGNRTSDSRYSLHFMYSKQNLVADNWYTGNTVGVFLMYSDGVVLRNNHIMHSAGPTGVGIGFKETSDLVVENNEVMYCASGLYIDVSPFQPGTTNTFTGNTIAYNGVGVRFLNDWHGNVFTANQFADNMTQVSAGGAGATANRNTWHGNYWSDYEGFDRDGDGVGDRPHEIMVYADRIWQDSPYAQFFKGTPLLETIDFLERLAPFSPPHLLVSDAAPLMRKEGAGATRPTATTVGLLEPTADRHGR